MMSRFAACPLRRRARRPDRLSPAATLAQEKTFELKLSHWVPPSHPAAEGAGRMGRLGGEGFRRHHQIQGLSRPAARQGLRPLRHGARRHRRPHLHQSRLPARPLPDHRRRRIAVPDVERQGRLGGARRLVPQIRGQGDEGRQVLPRLRARPRLVPFEQQEDRGAGRHQGHEDPPGADATIAESGHAARRHQRAGRRRRKCATSSSATSPTR